MEPDDQQSDQRQHGHKRGVAEQRRRNRRTHHRAHPGERTDPRCRQHHQPDQRVGQPDRPGEREAHPGIGGDALAALEAQPDRKAVSQNRAQRRGRNGPPGGLRHCLGLIKEFPGEQHRAKTLGEIEQQHRRRQPLAAGAQDIGRADIAAADLADVALARQSRENQPERNRAQPVAEQRGPQRGDRQLGTHVCALPHNWCGPSLSKPRPMP